MTRRLLLLGMLALGCAGCGASRPEVSPEREELMLHGRWQPESAERVLDLVRRRGRRSATFDPSAPPVVLFDWDNTAMRGDIGDLAFSWALDHDALTGLPPAEGFASLSPLRPDLAAELDASCVRGDDGRLPSHCQNLLSRIALTGLDLHQHDAFTVPIGASFKPSYALLSQLYVGLSHEEIASIGRIALRRALEAPLGARIEVAETEVEAFARITPELRELVELLRAEGFDVWIVSASHQALVEVAAAELGFAPDHVIGMRPRFDDAGRQRAGFVDPTDGLSREPITTYDVGKRIWASREIFGLRGADLRGAPSRAPVACFGDADTDFSMLDWASDLAFLFDRGYPRVSARAAEHPDRWVVQPVLEAP